MHLALTKTPSIDDPLKFCHSTPAQQDSRYMHIIDSIHGSKGGAPTSDQIIQDITKCAESHLLTIIAANGATVPNLESQNRICQVTGILSHSGHCVKKAYNLNQ